MSKSEIGELFDGYRDHKQQERSLRRSQASQTLTDNGILFTSHNNGAHIIINSPCRIDFWPGTNKWISGNKKGFGVKSLIEYIHISHGEPK